jgi:hypothetical protein
MLKRTQKFYPVVFFSAGAAAPEAWQQATKPGALPARKQKPPGDYQTGKVINKLMGMGRFYLFFA